MKSASCSPRVLVLCAVLAWLSPRHARAESSVSYKYEDYRESGGRIGVKTHGAHIEQEIGLLTKLKVDGILDAIAGATPNGQPAPAGSDQVPLSHMDERRKAWSASLSRQLQGVLVEVGGANSRESDYVSTGWSLNTVTDFNQKNTQLLAGIAGTNDKIKVFYSSLAPAQKKRTNDFIIGLTQLLDPQTSVSCNLTYGRQRGYLADPYKLVEKEVELVPGVFLPQTFSESRPMSREKWIVLGALNHAFAPLHGALDASYRLYHDTFGTTAHTLEAAWFQRVGEHVIVRPSLRYYDQSAADFYVYNLNTTAIVPYSGAPRANGPFYSSDYRLSALRTWTYGVKLIVNVTSSLQFDVALEQYDMRGKDGVTPHSAYPRARIATVGGRFSW